MRKVREKEDKDAKMMDELKQKYPKHLYDSGEEESDYDINEKEMHPERGRR